MGNFQANPNAYQIPAVRNISAITNANPAAVTTTFAHGYLTGAIVRLYIPHGYGMTQANFIKAPIAVTGDTTFTIAINTISFDAYVIPTPIPGQQDIYAQVVPVGEQTAYFNSSFMNILTPLY